jgi:2-amino-4-hydroxy-6-hydroxymethyldihydropteridine diphosphokinase
VQGKTELPPRELLAYLKKIEKKVGRKPSFIYGPRLVDIDILFYGKKVVNEVHLTIPHKKIAERAFVLVPLTEIAPGLKFPDSDQTISDLVNSIDISGVSIYEGIQE